MLALSLSAPANATRVTTLGNNNMILLDNSNMSLFPSRLWDYPNMAVAELDDADVGSIGVHWKFNEDKPWLLGTYFYNGTPDLLPRPATFGSVPLNENKRMDLFYARKLGDHVFGFHFGMRHSSYQNDAADDKDERALSAYRFEFGLTPDGSRMDLAAGLVFLSWTHRETAADNSVYDVTKPSGNMQFYMRGRYFWKIDERSTIIPHAEFSSGKYEAENYVNEGADLFSNDKVSETVINLGAGLQYTPATNILAVMDFGFEYMTEKDEIDFDDAATTDYEEKDKTFTLPYFKLGFEADVFRWMDLRLGSTSYWKNFTNEIGDDEYKEKYPDNETYLGLGFHWNRLNVDVQANPELFLDGFNFLSGRDNDMNFRISAIYEWL